VPEGQVEQPAMNPGLQIKQGSQFAVPRIDLTKMQKDVLGAFERLGSGIHRAKDVAPISGYKYNTRLKECLSLLVKLKYLRSSTKGYEIQGQG
jgi:hypothetical protein